MFKFTYPTISNQKDKTARVTMIMSKTRVKTATLFLINQLVDIHMFIKKNIPTDSFPLKSKHAEKLSWTSLMKQRFRHNFSSKTSV